MNRQQFLRRSALMSLAIAGLPRLARALPDDAKDEGYYRSDYLRQLGGDYLKYVLRLKNQNALLSEAGAQFTLVIEHYESATAKSADAVGNYQLESTAKPKSAGGYTVLKVKQLSMSGKDVLQGKVPKTFTVKIKAGVDASVEFPKAAAVALKTYDPDADLDDEAGCFLTTACTASRGLADDCVELQTLRQFRDSYMRPKLEGDALIGEYYSIAPQIVSRVNSLDNSAAIWDVVYDDLVKPSVAMVKAGKDAEAMQHYAEYVEWMKEAFM